MQPNEPAAQPTDSVTLSQEEYHRLRENSSGVTSAQPVYPIVGSQLASNVPDTSQGTAKDVIWFLMAAMVLASFIFPGALFLTVPIALFLLTGGKRYFSDASQHSGAVKSGTIILKIIALIGISMAIAFFCFVGFIIISISMITAGGGHI